MPRQDKDGATPGETKSRWTNADGDVRNTEPGSFSWVKADASKLRYLIALAATAGDAVSFAHNRANTGGSITILSGSARPRWYADDAASSNALLDKLAARYES